MLKGRCALITGSTQGLGYAMAERLAAEGCNIVLNGFGDAREIERKRRQLEDGRGVRELHHGADLADPGQIAAMVDTAQQSFGLGPRSGGEPVGAFHTSRLVLPACARAILAASSISPRSTACSPR
jgi:hypothetical protein